MKTQTKDKLFLREGHSQQKKKKNNWYERIQSYSHSETLLKETLKRILQLAPLTSTGRPQYGL